MAGAASPPTPVSVPPTHVVAWAAYAGVAAAMAVLAPLVGLVLVVLALVGALVWRMPADVAGRRLVALSLIAAIGGPNLAAPQLPQLFAFRILLIPLLVGFVVHMAVGGRLVWPRVLTLPTSLLAVWITWSLCSVLWADSQIDVFRWTGLLAMGAVLALMIPLAFGTRERAQRLLVVLLVAFVAVVAMALFELATGIRLPTSRLLDKPIATSFAATSFFGNENNLATYLTLTLPYFLALPLVFRDVRIRTLGIAGSLISLLLLLYTGSKTNLLALAVLLLTLFVVMLFSPQLRRRAIVGGGVAVIGAALILVPALNGVGPIKLPERALTKFSFSLLLEQVRQGTGSGAIRSDLLSEGVNFVIESGGVGLGAGNATEAVRALPNFPGRANLHNWWLEVSVSGGLIGLAIYLVFFALLISRQASATRSSDPFVRYMGLAGVSALGGFIVGSLAPSSVLSFAPMWITFGLCMTTMVLAVRAAADEDGS